MGNKRRIQYIGKNKKLKSGDFYTYKEFASVAGISYRCFVGRANNKRFISDKELVPLNEMKIAKKWRNIPDPTISRFVHHVEFISDKWLRQAL